MIFKKNQLFFRGKLYCFEDIISIWCVCSHVRPLASQLNNFVVPCGFPDIRPSPIYIIFLVFLIILIYIMFRISHTLYNILTIFVASHIWDFYEICLKHQENLASFVWQQISLLKSERDLNKSTPKKLTKLKFNLKSGDFA